MSKDLNATGRWLRKIGQSLGEPQDRDDLIAILRAAGERGVIDDDAGSMLEGVLDVADLQVRDIMVPRGQMISVRRDDPPARIVPTVVESGHSRFPVMDEDRDDIIGILLAKDLLRMYATGSKERFDIREYMRPVVFVPESKRLNVLLKEFRRNRNHMAIVVDEYGGVAGLVTIEDVIEQIVGEIDDEYDVEDDQNIRRAAVRRARRDAHRRVQRVLRREAAGRRVRHGGRARHEAARAPAAPGRIDQHGRLRVPRHASGPSPHRRAESHFASRRGAAAGRAAHQRVVILGDFG
jgi:magnesium and cobalt transporter